MAVTKLQPGTLYKIDEPAEDRLGYWASLYAGKELTDVSAELYNGDMFLCVARCPNVRGRGHLYHILTAHGPGYVYLDTNDEGGLRYGDELQVLA